MSDKRSILLIRLSAIGDIVMASPMLRVLRANYPGARISWLVQPECKALLENNSDLDEIIVWPRGQWHEYWQSWQWRRLWCEIRDFRRMLRERHFDLAIDLQGLLKSGVLAWLSGAKERIGLESKEGSGLLMTRNIEKGGDTARICSEYLHLVECMGLDPGGFEMRVALSASDLQFLQELVDKYALHSGYVVVCPFTTRAQKHWFDDRWVVLINRLKHELGFNVLILGGPGDRERSQRLSVAVGAGVIDMTGKTGLSQAAAIISGAKLLVGVDTGLTHMGIVFSRPTVALFGSTCPYLDTTRENALVLYHQFSCSPCRRNPTCDGEFSCMRALTIEEVMAGTRRVMDAACRGLVRHPIWSLGNTSVN